MNSIRSAQQAAQATALIGWLLATDTDGNEYANARRLGVMYIIWDNKIWGAYRPADGWRPYSSCASHPEKSWDTTCHRDHMHLSLSWAGAMGRTSFWTGTVAAQDYGRCRPADLNWAWGYGKPNPNRCARVVVVKPPKGASALLKTLTNYSGRHLVKGAKGAPVTAVQKAIKAKSTGHYDATTVAAVKKWQTAHKVKVTGEVDNATWRALLKALAPKPAS
jgi:peptidoglycan hydrolase-like protein with peptidoglycan-binding domain